ncbi:MAG: TlpA family protein disulfide reductase [Steroidobacteraceae bacterium]|jgi:thiol-disulfide isomerase/thioredoxin|nr:TlpA family protein disulfide reductase [Steroidobacteraceae bacterium]
MRPAAVAGLVAMAAIAGLAGYWMSARQPAPEAVPPSAAARQVPAELPDFTLADAAGQPRSIREWSGKSLIINFWATWCPPCRRELPLLNRLHADHADEGFQVIGVAVDFREDVLAFMQETPIDYPMLIGEQDGLDAARALGMENLGFPFTVFTDRRGRVVTVHVGELHAPQAEAILSAVASVDAGRLNLEAARNEIERALAAFRAERQQKPS